MATVISVMNNSMVTVLLPLIAQDFAACPAVLGWTATAFLLAFGVATPFCGRLSDSFGVRRVFCVGLVVFALGSALAVGAGGMATLIPARVVQGLGGAAIPALAAVTVARVLPPGRRGLGFGLLATGTGFAQAAGPVLGG